MPHHKIMSRGDLVIKRSDFDDNLLESFHVSNQTVNEKAPHFFDRVPPGQWQDKQDFDSTETGGQGMIHGVRVVHLRHNFNGMRTVLGLMHTQQTVLPKQKLTLDDLFHVCGTAQVFRAENVLAPYIQKWVSHARELRKRLSHAEDYDGRWFFIAYCLGLECDFIDHATEFVFRVGGYRADVVPKTFRRHVTKIREDMNKALLLLLTERMDLLGDSQKPDCRCGKHGCNEQMLGYMISYLRAEGFLQKPAGRSHWELAPLENAPWAPEETLNTVLQMGAKIPHVCLTSWTFKYQSDVLVAMKETVSDYVEGYLRPHFRHQALQIVANWDDDNSLPSE
ncbi:hypothetical protein F5Y18DRAFT_440252 [Xylariaceae sp. FL1019]|nr:hypothetical protein F5Y18DRAFT_440252 [Xylariaceae sp. FL1019]